MFYEVKEHAAWLTINREKKRNALNNEMIDLFFQHLDQAEKQEDVRVVCITGAGEKAFCAGADLKLMAEGGGPGGFPSKIARLLKRVESFPKPTVARVNGDCMGGGIGLMLACDMSYGKEGARFATPEVKVGLFPMMIGALIFPNVSRKKAMEMIYSGRIYSAREAEEMGLISKACSSETFDADVAKVLEQISANSPIAMRMGKKALGRVEKMDIDPALDYLCYQIGNLISTEDASEGIQAFMEKRKPVWKGC